MISIIIPFASNIGQDIKLPNHPLSVDCDIIYNTIMLVKNINNKINIDKEIILVDNTHSFPDLKMPNLKVVKGWQSLPEEEIRKKDKENKYKLDDLNNLSMWVSMAYNVGITHAKGDYIICQHNDIFYHSAPISDMIKQLEEEQLEYISVDYKKIFLSGYVANKTILDKYIKDIEISPDDGGYIKTKELGFADCYFFLCRKEFFDDYYVDWKYGDTNHGATIKCLSQGKSFLHLEPFHDNPNFETTSSTRDYFYNDKLFITHLKGGFSEDKFSYKNYIDKKIFLEETILFQKRFEEQC